MNNVKFNEHTDPIDFLKAQFEESKKDKSTYSLRSFAKKLQCTTSTVSRIFSGKRAFSKDLAHRWIDIFGLNEKEKKLFIILIMKKNASTDFEKKLCSELFNLLYFNKN